MAKWRFEDVNGIFDGDDGEGGTTSNVWEFEISPEEGGQPTIAHTVTTHRHTGPWPSVAMQQGRPRTPRIPFSGKVLTQEQYEAFERWYMYRILLDMVDDLGRRFRGVLVRWEPSRIYKPFDPWFHQYQAEFAVWAGTNASGEDVYGFMTDSGVDFQAPPPPPVYGDDQLSAPTSLVSTYISPTELHVSWAAVDGATSYNIEITADGVTTVVTGHSESSYTIVGPEDTDYVIRVAAVDGSGLASEWSEPLDVSLPSEFVFEASDTLAVGVSEASDIYTTYNFAGGDAFNLNVYEVADVAVMAVVGFVGFASSDTAGVAGGEATASVPAGTEEGDLMVAQVFHRNASGPTVPSGWTLLRSDKTNGFDQWQEIYTRVAGASEPASYTWTDDGGGERIGVGITTVRNAAGTGISVEASEALAHTTNSTDHGVPSVTSAGAGRMLLAFTTCVYAGPISWTRAASLTPVYGGATADRMLASREAIDAAGAVGTRTTTHSGTTHDSASTAVLIAPTA